MERRVVSVRRGLASLKARIACFFDWSLLGKALLRAQLIARCPTPSAGTLCSNRWNWPPVAWPELSLVAADTSPAFADDPLALPSSAVAASLAARVAASTAAAVATAAAEALGLEGRACCCCFMNDRYADSERNSRPLASQRQVVVLMVASRVSGSASWRRWLVDCTSSPAASAMPHI